MEDGMSLDFIKATQTSLGKYVKRPPLSEKLLKKPPFRFLHDIIITVVKTTGFFEGLFDENELISENVKDRENKILFLNKVIYVLCSATGIKLTVKPSKIIAGQDPENTNKLLQCLAQALDDNISSNEAVKLYKENGKIPNKDYINLVTKNVVNKPSETKKTSLQPIKKIKSREGDANVKDRNDAKTKMKENSAVKNESKNKKLSHSKLLPSKKHIENKLQPFNQSNLITAIVTPNLEVIESSLVTNHFENSSSETHEFNNQKMASSNIDVNIALNETEVNLALTSNDAENQCKKLQLSNELQEDYCAKNAADLIDGDEKVKTQQSNKTDIKENNNLHKDISEISQQLGTNILVDIKILDNDITQSEKRNYNYDTKFNEKSNISPIKSKQNINTTVRVRPSSSRPGAPRLREKLENYISDADNVLLGKVNIIAEHSPNEEEEDNNIIIIEQDNLTVPDIEDQLNLTSVQEHGHLVQQILNSQNELNHVKGKTEIEWQFGAQRAKEAQSQEIDSLRYNILSLSRVANPLGKLLDHIQEDVEAMRQELQQWTSIYEDVTKKMHIQKTLNEGALLPLHTKLKQINSEIQEKHVKINDLKILVHKNSMKIEKLLVVNNLQ